MNGLPTPYIFPVINIIGGPAGPDRNGGTWRPVKWWMFHEERIPAYLCQVMHGLDYRVKGEQWAEWISKPFGTWLEDWMQRTEYPGDPARHDTGYPFRSWMRNWETWQRPPGEQAYQPEGFLDSGGFTLMRKAAFQQARDWYGIDTTQTDILALQLRMGGNRIASLDYPLPPGLTEGETQERQQRSIVNAVDMLRLLSPDAPQTPYLALHGTTRANARWYADSLLGQVDHGRRFGLAIGSLVPRADDPRTVVEIAWGMREGLRAAGQTNRPMHAFGITSHLMAFLVYLGVNTFDSTTYVDVAKRAGWLDAGMRPVRVSDVAESHLRDCGCPYCNGILGMGVLPRMQQILTHGADREDGVNGYYHELVPGEYCTRSDLYALLAMHNWRQINRERERVAEAVQADRLPIYLAELVKEHDGQRGRKFADALGWLAQAEREAGEAPRLERAIGTVLNRTIVPVVRKVTDVQPKVRRSASDFSVSDDYQPPAGKDILLIMACSKEKPYRTSAHQRQVLNRIKAAFPGQNRRIHRVTLSGLYGPVPEELEDCPEVCDYDFLLEVGDDVQVGLVAWRLRRYLERYGEHYQAVVAHIVFPAYRAAATKALAGCGEVTPAAVKRGGKPADYLQELIGRLASALGVSIEPEWVQGVLAL